MQQQIDALLAQAKTHIDGLNNLPALEAVRVDLLFHRKPDHKWDKPLIWLKHK